MVTRELVRDFNDVFWVGGCCSSYLSVRHMNVTTVETGRNGRSVVLKLVRLKAPVTEGVGVPGTPTKSHGPERDTVTLEEGLRGTTCVN